MPLIVATCVPGLIQPMKNGNLSFKVPHVEWRLFERDAQYVVHLSIFVPVSKPPERGIEDTSRAPPSHRAIPTARCRHPTEVGGGSSVALTPHVNVDEASSTEADEAT